MFFRRVSPKQSYSFALVRTYFSPNGWHELGGLERLVMGFDVKDEIFSEFFPFKHCGIHFL